MSNISSFLNQLPTRIRTPLARLFGSGATLVNDITGDVTGDITGDVLAVDTAKVVDVGADQANSVVTAGSLVGALTGDATGNWNPLLPGVLQTDASGAGFPGTAGFVRCYSRLENGIIVTTYHIDLTGCTVKGGASDDVIGLGTAPAYFDQYTVAKHGIVFKMEMSMIELGAASGGTITNWICLTGESADTIGYDESGGTDQLIDPGAAMAVGGTYQGLVPTPLADDWFYLTEGDTAASSGTYNAGQIIITMWGIAAVLT